MSATALSQIAKLQNAAPTAHTAPHARPAWSGVTEGGAGFRNLAEGCITKAAPFFRQVY